MFHLLLVRFVDQQWQLSADETLIHFNVYFLTVWLKASIFELNKSTWNDEWAFYKWFQCNYIAVSIIFRLCEGKLRKGRICVGSQKAYLIPSFFQILCMQQKVHITCYLFCENKIMILIQVISESRVNSFSWKYKYIFNHNSFPLFLSFYDTSFLGLLDNYYSRHADNPFVISCVYQ